MTFKLVDTDWDDWRWAGQGVNPPGAPVAAVLTEVSANRWHWVYADGSVMAFPDQQISHDYKEGTDIQPHIHWVPTTSGLYTGVWTMYASLWLSGANGEPLEPLFTATAAFNATLTAGVEVAQNFSLIIPGAGRKISSNGTFTLSLALTSGVGCALTGFDGHYEKDTLGSRQILVK